MEDIIEIYTEATQLAMTNNQTVGKRNDYYITLEQLMELLRNN